MDGHGKPVVIMLVEDNEDHAILVTKALQGNGIANDIRVLQTGEEALDYLFRRGRYTDPASSPRPGLILLDLKLPGIDGIQVLRDIKQDATLKLIPAVMLTTSATESELVASYGLGVNSYIQKPVDFGKFMETVKELRMYWLLMNKHPHVA